MLGLVVLLVCISSLSTAFFVEEDPLYEFTWVNIPMTANWLGDYLLLFSCPSLINLYNEKGNIPLHVYMNRIIDSQDSLHQAQAPYGCAQKLMSQTKRFGFSYPFDGKSAAVAIFDHPSARITCGFLNNIEFPPGSSRNLTLRAELKAEIRAAPVPVSAFSQISGMNSCQTKMVLGRMCGLPSVITVEDMVEAKRRISEDFEFVGLTDEPDASAVLFFVMHNRRKSDRSIPDYLRGLATGKSARSHGSGAFMRTHAALKGGGYSDETDEELYDHIRDLFYRRCVEYEVSTQFWPSGEKKRGSGLHKPRGGPGSGSGSGLAGRGSHSAKPPPSLMSWFNFQRPQ